MLEIKNLHASVEDKGILKGIDLTVGAGEVHAIMGPNGSGKSTLANVLAGRDGYEVTQGSVRFLEEALEALELDHGLLVAHECSPSLPWSGRFLVAWPGSELLGMTAGGAWLGSELLGMTAGGAWAASEAFGMTGRRLRPSRARAPRGRRVPAR